ncbi:MAG TPA: hypothetical protein VL092_04095, partial [Chitinophagaceae bacterium]|nr:hypothetical protein [Chitinophagaceae bacterium]
RSKCLHPERLTVHGTDFQLAQQLGIIRNAQRIPMPGILFRLFVLLFPIAGSTTEDRSDK